MNPFRLPYSRPVVGAKARSCPRCGGKLYRRSGKPEQAWEHLRWRQRCAARGQAILAGNRLTRRCRSCP